MLRRADLSLSLTPRHVKEGIDPMKTSSDNTDTMITRDDERVRSAFVLHLAQLVRRGAEVEEQFPSRAVLVVPQKPSYAPNVLFAAIGVALFMTMGGVFFLLGAGAALLGWHRKLVTGVQYVRVLVRMDELGEVSEMELGRVQRA